MPVKKETSPPDTLRRLPATTLESEVTAIYRALDQLGQECVGLGLEESAARLAATAQCLLEEYARMKKTSPRKDKRGGAERQEAQIRSRNLNWRKPPVRTALSR